VSHPDTHRGACFCGAVEFAVIGEPVAAGYCHCESCRHWSASPVNAFTLWQPHAITVIRGSENILTYHKTEKSYRKSCRVCGGHLFTHHPGWDLTDVYAAVIPSFGFTPRVHVNYQETKLRISDGLPKFRDVPKEMGGSGVTLDE
jgi:hypothetical protein